MKKTVPKAATLIPDNATLMYQGIIYGIYQWQQELFDGSRATFEMLRRPDTAEAIGIVDGKILVLSDEQPHSGACLSLPGGRVDQNDADVLSAVKREMHEETGHSFKQWRLVSVRQPQSKIEWFIHVFVAWDVVGVDEPHADAGEKITVEHLSLAKVKELVAQKAGYLGELDSIFKDVRSIDDLISLPEYKGIAVDR